MHHLVLILLAKIWSRQEGSNLSRQILKNLILGEFTTSLGTLSQWMIVLIVEKL